MAEGILKSCKECHKERNCCCGFNTIDFPILSSDEYNLLVNTLNVDSGNFSQLENGCYNLIAKNSICPFYKNKCTIYKYRPNDCKLFPFDIKNINGKYYLVLYNLGCCNQIDMLNENVDDIVNAIKPYIKTFTRSELNLKMQTLDYTIIKEINV